MSRLGPVMSQYAWLVNSPAFGAVLFAMLIRKANSPRSIMGTLLRVVERFFLAWQYRRAGAEGVDSVNYASAAVSPIWKTDHDRDHDDDQDDDDRDELRHVRDVRYRAVAWRRARRRGGQRSLRRPAEREFVDYEDEWATDAARLSTDAARLSSHRRLAGQRRSESRQRHGAFPGQAEGDIGEP